MDWKEWAPGQITSRIQHSHDMILIGWSEQRNDHRLSISKSVGMVVVGGTHRRHVQSVECICVRSGGGNHQSLQVTDFS